MYLHARIEGSIVSGRIIAETSSGYEVEFMDGDIPVQLYFPKGSNEILAINSTPR